MAHRRLGAAHPGAVSYGRSHYSMAHGFVAGFLVGAACALIALSQHPVSCMHDGSSSSARVTAAAPTLHTRASDNAHDLMDRVDAERVELRGQGSDADSDLRQSDTLERPGGGHEHDMLQRCQVDLAMTRSRSAVVASNMAELKSRLIELQDQHGCDKVCAQKVRTT